MYTRRCISVASLLTALEWCAPLAWPGLASAWLVSHVPGQAAPGAESLALRYRPHVCNCIVRDFYKIKNDLRVEQDLIYKSNKLAIPDILQRPILP